MPRRSPRRAIALVVASALALAPVAPVPLAQAADAASSRTPVYGVTPPAPPAPVLPPVAPNTLPDLGDASQALLSPAQERKLGEAAVQQLRAAGGWMNDPEVNDYLNELGHRLIAASKDVKSDFEFFAVPDPGINAFALPGGYVGVNTGLILLAQNES